MNPYQFEVSCTVCGGPGMGTIRTAGAAWLPSAEIVHNDPRVCRDYLERRARGLRAREEQAS